MIITFLGSGDIGIPTLTQLTQQHQVNLVITQPDRPAGRKRKLTPTPIGQFAEQHQIPLIKTDNANSPEVINQIKHATPDAIVVIAFGQKLSDQLIALPKSGRIATMNLHTSLLPKYRGASPINSAILNGETHTGLSVIHLVNKMDAGDILHQIQTPIDPNETAGELHDRLAALGPQAILHVLNQIQNNSLNPITQDHNRATLAPKLSRADATVDFSTSANNVRCRIHGLTPWPGITFHYTTPDHPTPKPLKITRVKQLADSNLNTHPGTLFNNDLIACNLGAVQILEVQPPGKRIMSYRDFSRGTSLPNGTLFSTSPQ